MKKPIREMPNKWDKSHSIYTDDVENEVWLTFENLSSLRYLESIVRKRINDVYIKNLTNNLLQNLEKKEIKKTGLIQILREDDICQKLRRT